MDRYIAAPSPTHSLADPVNTVHTPPPQPPYIPTPPTPLCRLLPTAPAPPTPQLLHPQSSAPTLTTISPLLTLTLPLEISAPLMRTSLPRLSSSIQPWVSSQSPHASTPETLILGSLPYLLLISHHQRCRTSPVEPKNQAPRLFSSRTLSTMKRRFFTTSRRMQSIIPPSDQHL